MMSARETATRDKEEWAEEEEGQEEGVARFAGATSVGSTRGRFAVSYAALL